MEDLQNLIERFFDKELDEDELLDFQRRLKEDADFARAFEMEKDILESIESLGNDHLRKELQQIHREEIEQKDLKSERQKSGISRLWWIVAAILLTLSLLWYFAAKSNPTPEQLYAQYAQHHFSFAEKSGPISQEEEWLLTAEKELNSGNYQAALSPLSLYLEVHPDDQKILLAQGIALLETGKDYATARNIFQNIINSKSLLVDDGKWYLALLELKQGNLQACQKMLEQIPEGAASYQKSKSLLKYLNGI